MDVKLVYADSSGALSVLPDAEAGGPSPFRAPPSVPLAVAYLTMSSAAAAANVMVLTGVVAVDRLRSPYAVLASALCLQCALDAAAGHCVVARELTSAGGGGPALCRGVATVTAALPVVQLVTLTALACLGARPGHDRLPLPAAAALWAAPSVYTYVALTPTLMFSARYFPSRGRCGFLVNGRWPYPTALAVFGFAVPWSISLCSVLLQQARLRRPSTGAACNVPPPPRNRGGRGQPPVLATRWSSCKWMFASYTVLVTPALVSSFVRGLSDDPTVRQRDDPWAGDRAAADPQHAAADVLDGCLSRLPVVFDALVPLVLVYHHKAFRKKCRELYMHGFRNAVSDGGGRGTSVAAGRPKPSRSGASELCLTDDTPVLFLQERSGAIGVRCPSDHGFLTRTCDLPPQQRHDVRPMARKAVRFFSSRRGSRNVCSEAAAVSGESGVYGWPREESSPTEEESCV